MRVFETFSPVSTDEPETGIFVYDFGQNASAKSRLRIRAGARPDRRFGCIRLNIGASTPERPTTALAGSIKTAWGNRTTGSTRWRRAGIRPDPDGPAFKKTIIDPRTDGTVKAARGVYRSHCGTIESDWRKTDGGMLLNISIPVNTTVTVRLPADAPGNVRKSGETFRKTPGVEVLREQDGRLELAVGSGDYAFSVEQ